MARTTAKAKGNAPTLTRAATRTKAGINRTDLNTSNTTAVVTLITRDSSNTMEEVVTRGILGNNLTTASREALTTAEGIKNLKANIPAVSSSIIAVALPTVVAVATKAEVVQAEVKALTTPLKKCLTLSFLKDPST